jgi:Peptidase family M1 domain/ERAP1-like C-terminal domain
VLDEAAPTGDKRQFGMIVAHELAHQWFGDLVTPTWWDDIWLNESFANWMGYRIGHAWRPGLNIGAGALAEGFAAMKTDALTSGRPIRQPIDTNAQIDSAFDSITYGKGGHVVAMMAAFMGDERFRSGVRRYMAAHRYGNATSTDFFTAMAEAAGDPRIVPAMKSFTDQQGVPLLTFARDGDGWLVSQSRYAPLGATSKAQTWGVPMCVRRGATRTCQLLDQSSDRASDRIAAAGTGPLVPNAGGTGYYRFELAPADWDALIAGARSLDGGEAQAVADSLTASVRSGNAGAGQLAALARVLADHPDSYAADTAVDGLASLWTSGVVGRAGRSGWRRLLAGIFAPRLARLGFDPKLGAYAGEDPEVSQRRAQAVDRLAGTGADKAVRRTLLAATRAWLAGDKAALDPVWFGRAFDLAIGDGGLPAARRVMEAALASEDAALRPVAIAAVAGSGDREVANWLLGDFRDTRLRPAEQRNLLPAILLSRPTRDIGYAYLHGHIDELLSGNTGIFYSAKMPGWLRRYCSVATADAFALEFRPKFAGRSGALTLERTLDQIRDCGELEQRRGQAITAGFKRFR